MDNITAKKTHQNKIIKTLLTILKDEKEDISKENLKYETKEKIISENHTENKNFLCLKRNFSNYFDSCLFDLKLTEFITFDARYVKLTSKGKNTKTSILNVQKRVISRSKNLKDKIKSGIFINEVVTQILYSWINKEKGNLIQTDPQKFTEYLVQDIYIPLIKNGICVINDDIPDQKRSTTFDKLAKEILEHNFKDDLINKFIKQQDSLLSVLSIGLNKFPKDFPIYRASYMYQRTLMLLQAKEVENELKREFLESNPNFEKKDFVIKSENSEKGLADQVRETIIKKIDFLEGKKNDFSVKLFSDYFKNELAPSFSDPFFYEFEKKPSGFWHIKRQPVKIKEKIIFLQKIDAENHLLKHPTKDSCDIIIFLSQSNHKAIIVNNVSELISNIKGLCKEKENSVKELYFRGHADCNWTLTPGIARNLNLKTSENSIYEKMIVKNADEFKRNYDHLDILTKMQHYKVPTRLLDVTKSLSMAIFFACESQKIDGKDSYEKKYAEIIVFSLKSIKYFRSDNVAILASLPTMQSNRRSNILELAVACELAIKELEENGEEDKEKIHNTVITIFNRYDKVKKLLHEVNSEKNFSGVIDPKTLVDNFFVQPILDNRRIINQQGAFVVMSLNPYSRFLSKNEIDLDTHFFNSQRLHCTPDNQIYHFLIPYWAKKNFIDFISFLGTNQTVVYPEIDRTADYVSEFYNHN